jgi:hypothetical protein
MKKGGRYFHAEHLPPLRMTEHLRGHGRIRKTKVQERRRPEMKRSMLLDLVRKHQHAGDNRAKNQ